MATAVKHSARFLIVKYIPDMQRMEPRNVGVILWADGHVIARFFGEGQDDSALRPPPFIAPKNRTVYAEWVRHWKRTLAKPKLGGVPRESIEFVRAIRERSSDNYVVVEGGEFLTGINPNERTDAVNEIFDRFVGEEPPVIKLKQACDRAIKTALSKEQFAKDFPFECRVAGKVTHTFKFNYAGIPLGNLPRALFQRVDLEQDGSVNSATLMFESAAEKKMRIEQCGALVTGGELYHPDATELLRSFATIVDVSNLENAAYAIRHMSGLNGEPKPK